MPVSGLFPCHFRSGRTLLLPTSFSQERRTSSREGLLHTRSVRVTDIGVELEESPEDMLVTILTKSGFRIVPIQTVVDALSQMEEYIRDQTGLSQEELESYLEKIENLVGREEAFKMELDDIVAWIEAMRDI